MKEWYNCAPISCAMSEAKSRVRMRAITRHAALSKSQPRMPDATAPTARIASTSYRISAPHASRVLN